MSCSTGLALKGAERMGTSAEPVRPEKSQPIWVFTVCLSLKDTK